VIPSVLQFFSTNIICQTIVQHCAPLAWKSPPRAVLNCDSLSLLSNPDLKLVCFLLLSANYFTYMFCQRLCTA